MTESRRLLHTFLHNKNKHLLKDGITKMELISNYRLGDMCAVYYLNGQNRAVLFLLPSEKEADFSTGKNRDAAENASLVHLQLSKDNPGFFSNSYRLSETLSALQYQDQRVTDDGFRTTIVTTEEASGGYGIRHYLIWEHGDAGLSVYTEFYNNSGETLYLDYLTSVSLDGISPYLPNEGSADLVFHRFKAGWSMEGLLQSNTLIELGLERAWGMSGECLKLGAIGSRPVREYHPYAAIEDTKSGVTWGMYLAHNASWQMELSRVTDSVSLSIGLADYLFGHWRKTVPDRTAFSSPVAYVSVVSGGIADLSNRLLSMRHRVIDALHEEKDMAIVYNDYVTTWGHPTHEALCHMADLLSKGKTKYLVMDAGWFTPRGSNGDWIVNAESFPKGMKAYCDEIRAKGMIPGVWMEFEDIGKNAALYETANHLVLKRDGHPIVGHVINGGREKFWDFRNPEVVQYLTEKVIRFLRENGFGYLKIDYNASIGIGIDGEESIGENLRAHMELVRNFILKIREEVPGIVIENCASGGCRLEPSMMDITEMSSASDTHEVYECAVVSANLHYLTPPRQNQIWASLHPEYSPERFSYVISQTFLGRLCWSGKIAELSDAQRDEMFRAEAFYAKVSHIIKRGNSYIYRTKPCSFHSPSGTQTVVRYSEDGAEALVVVHHFRNSDKCNIQLNRQYRIAEKLYPDDSFIENGELKIGQQKDFSGNVYWLK